MRRAMSGSFPLCSSRWYRRPSVSQATRSSLLIRALGISTLIHSRTAAWVNDSSTVDAMPGTELSGWYRSASRTNRVGGEGKVLGLTSRWNLDLFDMRGGRWNGFAMQPHAFEVKFNRFANQLPRFLERRPCRYTTG